MRHERAPLRIGFAALCAGALLRPSGAAWATHEPTSARHRRRQERTPRRELTGDDAQAGGGTGGEDRPT